MELQICVTIYNKPLELVKRAIESIPDNIYVRVDIDGGWNAPNDLLNYLKSCESDSRFKKFDLYHWDINLGLGMLHNIEIDECNYEYIQFLDADDWLNPDVYTKFISEVPNDYDIIITPTVFTDNHQETIDRRNCRVAKSMQQTYFCIPTIIFKTQYLIDNQLLFDESGYIFEDVLFSVRLTDLNPVAKVFEIPYYYGNDVPDNGTTSLSHPIDNYRLIESTKYVIDQLMKHKSEFTRRDLAYGRIVEECLRLIKLAGDDSDIRNWVIEVLKPYKFFKE